MKDTRTKIKKRKEGKRKEEYCSAQAICSIQELLALAKLGAARRLGMRLGALRNGHHGALGPDVDCFCPVEALDAAALDGEYVF